MQELFFLRIIPDHSLTLSINFIERQKARISLFDDRVIQTTQVIRLFVIWQTISKLKIMRSLRR